MQCKKLKLIVKLGVGSYSPESSFWYGEREKDERVERERKRKKAKTQKKFTKPKEENSRGRNKMSSLYFTSL